MITRCSRYLLKNIPLNLSARFVCTLSAKEAGLATANWIERINSNAIEDPGKEKRSTPLGELRWLEAGFPIFDASKEINDAESVNSGYLPHGYHLALPQTFRVNPPRIDELRSDGTFTGDFYDPPHPFTRRMWASGQYTFHPGRNISVKEPLYLRSKILKVEGKDLGGSEPKVFFTRRFEWGNEPNVEMPAISEDRTHVFLTSTHKKSSRPDISQLEAQFKVAFRPSTTLLFRFSAVSQNDHKIHYEDAYCREVERLPGLAVHGPLTALLLTRLATIKASSKARLSQFQYRAIHPIIVGNECTLSGAWMEKGKKLELWASDGEGTTCMKATATFESRFSTTWPWLE